MGLRHHVKPYVCSDLDEIYRLPNVIVWACEEHNVGKVVVTRHHHHDHDEVNATMTGKMTVTLSSCMAASPNEYER